MYLIEKMALRNNFGVGCRHELVREEHAAELIANKFAPTSALFLHRDNFSGLLCIAR